jgi:hypothetical protein
MRVLLVVLLVGCVDPVAARWQLDHDHVVAARATPPRIMPGDVAMLDALVAREGTRAAIESPVLAAAPLAPEEMTGLLVEVDGRWQLTAPPDETLASVRPGMGLDPGAPVPIDVVMQFTSSDGEPMYVKKTVWLGARAENPAPPAVLADDEPMPSELAIPTGRDIYVEALASGRVSWLTSCGELFQDDVARAFVRAAEPCDGELAVVVRDSAGGVVWQLWPILAQ